MSHVRSERLRLVGEAHHRTSGNGVRQAHLAVAQPNQPTADVESGPLLRTLPSALMLPRSLRRDLGTPCRRLGAWRSDVVLAVICAGAVIAFSQWLEALVHDWLSSTAAASVNVGVINLIYVRNPRSADGLLDRWPDWSVWALALLDLVLLVYLFRSGSRARASWVGLGLALGGASSNLVDRLTRGYVADVISLSRHHATNPADIAIAAGGLILAAMYMRQTLRRPTRLSTRAP